MPALPYCVYVLQSHRDAEFYIGFTTDLGQRLTSHFHGHVKSTALRRPFRLIYCEYHGSATDARRREQYFKTNPGKKTLKLILRDALAPSPSPPPPAQPDPTLPSTANLEIPEP